MFKKAHDICTLVVNLFGQNWVPKHITIGLFEALCKHWQEICNTFYNNIKISFAYVKDERSNLDTMTTILKLIVKMGVVESFQGTCFGHAFSNTYQYATIKKKM